MEYNNKNNNTKYEKEVVNISGTQIHEVSADEMSVPLVFIDRDKLNTQHFYLFCKRCFDIVVSVIAGLILLVRWRYNRDNQEKVPILNAFGL